MLRKNTNNIFDWPAYLQFTCELAKSRFCSDDVARLWLFGKLWPEARSKRLCRRSSA